MSSVYSALSGNACVGFSALVHGAGNAATEQRLSWILHNHKDHLNAQCRIELSSSIPLAQPIYSAEFYLREAFITSSILLVKQNSSHRYLLILITKQYLLKVGTDHGQRLREGLSGHLLERALALWWNLFATRICAFGDWKTIPCYVRTLYVCFSQE